MYVSTTRLFVRMTSVARSLAWLGLGLALALYAQVGLGADDPDYLVPRPEVFRAQDPQGMPPGMPPNMPPGGQPAYAPAGSNSQFGDVVEDGLLFGDSLSGRSTEAYGALFRAGVWTGPAVGRTETIVPLEIMPYAFMDRAMVFASVRGFRAATDGWGMNVGGGLRYYSEKWDRIFGINAFYDYDNSSGALFREVGFGLESLGALWDMRANAYIPHGSTDALLKTELVEGSQRFVDHRMLYDNQQTFGNALRGVDWELGIPVPGRVPQRHNLKVFGGWYYFSGSETEGFGGWKTRAQADVVKNVTIQLDVANDHVFDTTVVFGATWTYGGFRQPEDQKITQFDRMTEMVRRSYNVNVALTQVLDPGKVAINPLTDQPYFFEHVASYAASAGANGTVEHPWQTLTEAQTALNAAIPNVADQAGNIIFVHANSVYNTAPENAVTLTPTVRILGEGDGIIHTLRVPELGNIRLPRATNFSNRPVFANQAGVGVTLVSGTAAAPSEFSGFDIGDPGVASSGPAGVGILGDGVANVVVNQTNVNFAQGDGVLLNNLSGAVTMRGTVINNITNTNSAIDGLHIVGGTSDARVIFGVEPITLRRSQIINTGGYSLEIDGTARGSIIDLTGSDITDGTLASNTVAGRRGGGILLNNIDGVAIIDNATIVNTITDANTTGRGINIVGTAATALTPARGLGQISFLGDLAIDNPAGDAIHIEGLQTNSAGTPATVRFVLPDPINGVLAPGIRITNRNAGGVTMLNNFGNIAFLEPVAISSAGAPAAAAISYQGNSGTASFLDILPSSNPNQIQISGGGGNGIEIGNIVPNTLTGAFRVTGTTSIQQVQGISLLVGDPTAVAVPPALPPTSNHGPVSFEDVNIDNRSNIGIQVIGVDNAVQFTGTTTVANTLNSLSTAVDIRYNQTSATSPLISGDVTFRTLNILAAQGPVALPITSAAGLNIIDNPRSVAIQQLNINQNSLVGSGTALFADNVGTRPAVISTTSVDPTLGLSIGSGNISANGGPAVVIQNSTIGVQLTSISATNSSSDGIYLENNVGPGSKVNTNATTVHPTIFTVTGVTNVAGSGGLIQGSALEGAYILNSEGVQFRNMDFIGNRLSGIYASTPEMTILGNRISGNDAFGVNILGVAVELTQANRNLQTVSPIFTMQGSTVTGNGNNGGISGTQQVLFTAATRGDYTINLGASGTTGANVITHAFTPGFAAGIHETRGPAAGVAAPTSDDGVLIRTLGNAIGSRLNLSAVNNTISVTRPILVNGLLSDMRVLWNGQVNAGAIQSNVFNFGADQAEGLVLNLQSTSATANFRIAGNTFNSPAGVGTSGINVTTNGGATDLQIGDLDGLGGNVMNFIQPNVNFVGARIDDAGMRFALGANSNVNIFDNTITMTGQNIEGIQFASVVGPSTVTLNRNTIDLQGGLFNLYGIRVLAVTSGTLDLFGPISNDITINQITGSTFPWFFVPTTGTRGQVNINGVLVP